MCGPEGRVAEEAPSRDALRGILRGDAKRTLDCARPRGITAIKLKPEIVQNNATANVLVDTLLFVAFAMEATWKKLYRSHTAYLG